MLPKQQVLLGGRTGSSCRPPNSSNSIRGATIPFSDGNQGRSTVRALVVDDFQPFRQFVFSMLGRIPGLQIVGEAADGLEAVQKAKELRPDLIVLDIGLPKLNGIEASHRLLRFVPSANVLFVSQENDADVVATALSNGARGYVLKLDANRDLLHAVESVLRGQHFVSTGVSAIPYKPIPWTNLPLSGYLFLHGSQELQPFNSQVKGDFNPTFSDGRATLSVKTTAPSTGVPFTSTLNSLAGTVKSVKPHSKQTASLGNTHTIGLSKPFNPGKWMAISPLSVS